jgi:hypothetical protein
MLNWDLLRQPYNWLIVALMLAIAVFALHLLQPSFTNPLSSLT